jgi:steroid delta-isomerase-like uncharacterized protein
MAKYGEAGSVAVSILEAWNEKDYDRGFAALADDFTVIEVSTGETYTGRDGLRDEYTKWHTGFSDGWMEITTVIENGNGLVAVETIVHGTHDGVFVTPEREYPPSGRRLHFEMCTIAHVRDGKEFLERHYFDGESFLRQLVA